MSVFLQVSPSVLGTGDDGTHVALSRTVSFRDTCCWGIPMGMWGRFRPGVLNRGPVFRCCSGACQATFWGALGKGRGGWGAPVLPRHWWPGQWRSFWAPGFLGAFARLCHLWEHEARIQAGGAFRSGAGASGPSTANNENIWCFIHSHGCEARATSHAESPPPFLLLKTTKHTIPMQLIPLCEETTPPKSPPPITITQAFTFSKNQCRGITHIQLGDFHVARL